MDGCLHFLVAGSYAVTRAPCLNPILTNHNKTEFKLCIGVVLRKQHRCILMHSKVSRSRQLPYLMLA
jgi:hypothetical protein